jgi:hypothetical protein
MSDDPRKRSARAVVAASGGDADTDVRAGPAPGDLAERQAPAPKRIERDLRLDACRGIALWCVFVDHMPVNVLSWLTPRNFGFSDTTEIFVFVSGATCALAYGASARRHGWGNVVARTLRRSFEIYIAFVMVVLACTVLAFYAGEQFLNDSNTHIVLDQPGPALAHALIMQYRPANTDILPTFVLFHVMVAPLLFALRRVPNATLAASVLLYVLTHRFDWNVPQWPVNTWYFNPFAWQLLFVFGAWWASYGGARLWPLIRSHVPVLSIAYVIFSFIVVLGWTVGPLENLVPNAIARLIYPVDKSGLDPLRLLHFLAMAALAAHYVPRDWLGFGHRGPGWRDAPPGAPVSLAGELRRRVVTPVMRAAIRCGENSLSIYCFSVPLSLAGYFILATVSDSLVMQVCVGLAGIGILIAVASALAWVRIQSRQQPGLF